MAARPGRAKRLYLIDGMPLVYRAYFVFLNRPLITANGFNSSAVYGYTTSLLQILNDEQPTHLAVVFDTPGPTWRDREYADYKGTRAKAPEDIGASLPHVRRITEAMGLSVITHDGVEADDVIGTLAARAEAAGFDTYMVTLDKDFAQLVSDHVFLYRVPRMAGDPPQVYDVAARARALRGGAAGAGDRPDRAGRRQRGQHPGRAGGGGEDRAEADRPVRLGGGAGCRHRSTQGQAAGEDRDPRRAGAAVEAPGHHRPRAGPGAGPGAAGGAGAGSAARDPAVPGVRVQHARRAGVRRR